MFTVVAKQPPFNDLIRRPSQFSKLSLELKVTFLHTSVLFLFFANELFFSDFVGDFAFFCDIILSRFYINVF